jgi:hypothetical protein
MIEGLDRWWLNPLVVQIETESGSTPAGWMSAWREALSEKKPAFCGERRAWRMSVEPGRDRSEIVLHALEPFRVVPAKGAEAVSRAMRHRDDARAVSSSGGDARISDDVGKGVCPVIGARAPFIENNNGARRLDQIEEVREARQAIRIGGEEIDRDEVEAKVLYRQGDGCVSEPLD